MSDPAIVINPDPPTAGDNVTVTYTGSLPVTLRYKLDPPNTTWVPFELTSTHPGHTFALPDDCVALIIEDTSGGAPYRDVPVA